MCNHGDYERRDHRLRSTQEFREHGRPGRPRPHRHHRRGARLPRPQRVGQVDDDPHPARPAARRRRRRPGARRRPVERRRDVAPAARLRARRRDDVAHPHRRRGHRLPRAAARRPRPGQTRLIAGALRPGPNQEGSGLFQGQPAEGCPRRSTRLRRRPAAARRTHRWPGPPHGASLPRLHRRGPRARSHRAAVQPHPVRGGGALRPREHHQTRPHRRVRHPRRPAPPHPHVPVDCAGASADRSRPRAPHRLARRGHRLRPAHRVGRH